MKKFFIQSIIIIMVLNFSGCNKQQKETRTIFDYGKIVNNVYTNSFFGMKLQLPENWVAQTQEQTEAIMEMGKNLVAGDNKEMKTQIEASEVKTANLLALFEHEIGAPVDFNANMMVIAENIKASPGIRSGKDYLFQARKMLQMSQFQYDYMSEEFEYEDINGTDFYKLHTISNFASMEIKQTYYSTVIKNFSINIIISYLTKEQHDILLQSIHSLKLD